jgi:hypothetical protein
MIAQVVAVRTEGDQLIANTTLRAPSVTALCAGATVRQRLIHLLREARMDGVRIGTGADFESGIGC